MYRFTIESEKLWPRSCLDLSLPHRTLLERELGGKVHARSQSERICVQHWVEGIKRLGDLAHCGVVGLPNLRYCWRMHRLQRGQWLHRLHRGLALHSHGMPVVGGLLVDGWIGCGTLVRRVFAGVGLVEHVRMRIVLLFCTHGINLGRTELYIKEREGGGGSACRVALCESEMVMGSSSSEYWLHSLSRCSPSSCWRAK